MELIVDVQRQAIHIWIRVLSYLAYPIVTSERGRALQLSLKRASLKL